MAINLQKVSPGNSFPSETFIPNTELYKTFCSQDKISK